MGEYAQFKGEQIKIGTCEDMYYLRFDQRAMVTAERGSVNPVTDAEALRFRFPFPDEDGLEPGDGRFHENGYHRGIGVHGFTAQTDVEHYTVQFVAQAGYNVSLPCPESSAYAADQPANIRMHRNGCGAVVQLVAQRLIPGIGLVPILRCTACGTMWREIERARIEQLVVSLRSEADSRGQAADGFYHVIADRVLAGVMVSK